MTYLPLASTITHTLRLLVTLVSFSLCSGQTPSFGVAEPPSFVIAEMGVRHELKPSYFTISDWINPESALGRTYKCTLISGPEGLLLSEEGILEWNPESGEIGNSGDLEVRVQVIKDALSIFEWTEPLTLQVLAGLPELAEIPFQVSYERRPIGWSLSRFSGYQPTDNDKELFEWSLINPPAGVFIDSLGGIHWHDERGYSRTEPYTFKIKFNYKTPNGWLQDEVTYQRRILPQPATNNYGELRTFNLQPTESGMLGFSLVAADGWIVAGEPFPNSTNPGRVRLWKWNDQNDTWSDTVAFQSDVVIQGDAFGASLSISPRTPTKALKLAIGAPDSAQIGSYGETKVSVGAVHLYTANPNNTWSKEVTIPAPLAQQSLDFGNSVSIAGQTLVAGMPGRNIPGYDAGALAVYRHDGSQWLWSQTLQAKIPAWGDRFGEAAFLEEGWVAAAAPGDDQMADNAGVVHLFWEEDGVFIHQQQFHSPNPNADDRFGERLLMSGAWLFVSSYREEENRGAVHVYHRAGGLWSFQQSLISPYAEAGSAFGMAMSISHDVLAVSAPGYRFDHPDFNADDYPWKGITLFRRSGETWEWERQVTESPDGSPDRHTWGYALAQIGANRTVTSIPDLSPSVNGVEKNQAGRLFLHRWPELIGDPFLEALARLPPINGRAAEADDDSNHDGIPNIIEWMMGSDPGASPTSWESAVPASRKPFVRRNALTGAWEFMIPQLVQGLNQTPFVEISNNLSDWSPVGDARWGALEDVYFPGKDGSSYHTYFHPVTIPPNAEGEPVNQFYRWGVR